MGYVHGVPIYHKSQECTIQKLNWLLIKLLLSTNINLYLNGYYYPIHPN